MTDAERTITAHHEAGHALAYIHFHIEFRYVAVYRNPAPGEELGALQPLAHQSPPQRRAVVCLCGPAAESRYTGEPLARLFKAGCRTDLRMAQDALRRDPEADLRSALRDACALAEAQWSRSAARPAAQIECRLVLTSVARPALCGRSPSAAESGRRRYHLLRRAARK